jgi:hypothetical protein
MKSETVTEKHGTASAVLLARVQPSGNITRGISVERVNPASLCEEKDWRSPVFQSGS